MSPASASTSVSHAVLLTRPPDTMTDGESPYQHGWVVTQTFHQGAPQRFLDGSCRGTNVVNRSPPFESSYRRCSGRTASAHRTGAGASDWQDHRQQEAGSWLPVRLAIVFFEDHGNHDHINQQRFFRLTEGIVAHIHADSPFRRERR